MLAPLTSTRALYVAVALVALIGGGCDDGDKTALHYSPAEIQQSFESEGLPLVRQETGPFRDEDANTDGCVAFHSGDFRTSAMVCRTIGSSFMLLQVLPETQATRTFESAVALLGYLSAHPRSSDPTPILVVDKANVTISYVGRDERTVRAIDRVVRALPEGDYRISDDLVGREALVKAFREAGEPVRLKLDMAIADPDSRIDAFYVAADAGGAAPTGSFEVVLLENEGFALEHAEWVTTMSGGAHSIVRRKNVVLGVSRKVTADRYDRLVAIVESL